MSAGPGNPLEGDLEDMGWRDGADRTKTLQGIPLDPRIDFPEFRISQSGICLGKGNQLPASVLFLLPKGKGIIRKEVAPCAHVRAWHR